MDNNVGNIGLGIMGSAMASNLIRDGFDVVGYDIQREQRDALVADGGKAALSR